MKHFNFWKLMIVIFTSVSSFAAQKGNINLIPMPNKMVVNDGFFVFKNGMTFSAPPHSRAKALLCEKLAKAAGIELKQKSSNAQIQCRIKENTEWGTEGYSLTISKTQIKLEAATENGLYYGVQSILQLLPPQIESPKKSNASWKVPCVSITDAPRFSYRGILLDCSRHFTTVTEIKKIMDMMAMYKINKFHWHLTDDQGWRIEIKRYPKLTEIGSVRTENGKPYAGFYTQEEIKDIVKYAAERNIEVIPEIEMPGHALAALSAYPEYSCTGGPFHPRTIWGVEDDVFCAGNEATYQFLENILDEVCTLFPSKYLHLGGDECPKTRWKNCPKCQAKMKENGLKNEEELQSYFTKRMEKYVESKGKRLLGWDEIMEGGIAPSATIMSWRGEQGGIDAANAGHDVVMTPWNYMYLDQYQGDLRCEKVKIGGLITLQKMYGYDPVPKDIAAEQAHHVLGLQGNLWQEYMYNPNQIEFQLFPRITAIAETGWTQAENKNSNSFIHRIDDQEIRWDFHELNYYIPMPEGNMNYIQFVDKVKLSPFTSNRPVKIVYTLDSTEPTSSSNVYTNPFTIDRSLLLKIRSILPQGKLSPVRTIKLTKIAPYQSVSAPDSLRKGLKMRYTKDGNFTSTQQLGTISDWKDTVIANVNDFFKLKKKEQSGGAAIFEGYLHVEKTGNYILHCLADQCFLCGELLIENNEMKKNAPTDIALPLSAGYYPLKVVLLNRQYRGVLSEWVDARPTLRPIDSEDRSFPTTVYY